MEKIFVTTNEYKEFKAELSQNIKEQFELRDELLKRLESDHSLQSHENSRFMSMIGDNHNKLFETTIQLNKEACLKFESMFESFKAIIQKDVRLWRQKHDDIQSSSSKLHEH